MQTKIAFVGNCQAYALGTIYKIYLAPDLDEEVVIVDLSPSSPEEKVAESLGRLHGSNVIVEQVFDFPGRLPQDFFTGSVKRFKFPYVAGMLWPFSTEVHPHNRPHRWLDYGPYDGELGDSFLNRAIRDKIPAKEAARRYLDLDIARVSHADRVLEIHLDRQRQRDLRTDIRTIDFIESRLREEALFSTKGHPRLGLLKFVCRQVFAAIGVPYSLIDRAMRCLRVPPYPTHELPIHPRLATHLGLQFVAPEQTYRFHQEGRFSFVEFAERYVDYTWEPDLREGIALAGDGRAERALMLLRATLPRCPGSVAGWRAQALALSRLGHHAEADAAIARAIDLDPEDPDNFSARARLLLRRGEFDGAEQAACETIDLFPFALAGHHALAEILAERGRFRRAFQVARMAVALMPGDEQAVAMLRHCQRQAAEQPISSTDDAAESMGNGALADGGAATSEAAIDLDFRKGGNAAPCLGSGWSVAEHDFTWAQDDESTLMFDAPAEPGIYALSLTIGAFIHQPDVWRQRMQILLNDQPVGHIMLTDSQMQTNETVLGAAVFRDATRATLRFLHQDAARPCDIGQGQDSRRLAIAFRRLTLVRLRATDA